MFSSLHYRDDVYVAILTAEGDRTFMAGADLRRVDGQREDRSPSPTTSMVDPGYVGRTAHFAVYDCPVPVIGAINARVVGTGVAYAAVCDILIAAEGVTFNMPELRVGLLGGTAFLAMLVPRHKVRELFFTGDSISAEELHRMGTVSAVVPRADLMPTANRLARRLIDVGGPLGLRLVKESANRAEFKGLKDGYWIEQDYTNRLVAFQDSKEARRAFLEKRTPVWTGK